MIDPWTQFTEQAISSEVAVYFERTGKRGQRGTAAWSVRPSERRVLDRQSELTDLSARSGRFLDRHPRGGILGYVGFDAVGLFEPALCRFPVGTPFPLGELAFVDRLETRAVPHRRRRALEPRRPPRPVGDSLGKRPFEAGVRRLIREIRDGEAFQVVLAHRRSWKRPADLLARAGTLRATERFSFFYFLRFGDREIVGASPESVVEMRGGVGFINPIAGTMPATPRAGRLPLPKDPKELSEHRMLVDLARNDLGRVARPGTVRVLQTERRERYARLEHLVSEVGGRLVEGIGPWELLAAAFPAGTVSGAPKIRATELLRREEDSWRGPYGGAVGCLRPGGRADWALAIRTAFAAGPTLYTAAGAGIVHRSRPAQEYEETLAKLEHLESTLLGDAP
ncbi:MAG: anthranilate synthase component I family protein [Thermoplasmata archaeon]